MSIWIAMAALAAAAFLPVMAALTRSEKRRPGRERRPAVAIYRDQLDEVERDIARGVIGDGEASAARTEIARRLIRAGDDETPGTTAPTGRPWRAAAVVVAMPVAAFGFYLLVGAPQLPDQPLAARLAAPADTQDVAALIARVETHLAADPDDGTGWEVIAPVYMSLGRYSDAVRAYTRTIATLGETAGRVASLGEALTAADQGRISDAARAAFERANALAPEDARPRFYLAMALGQDGRREEAIAAWHALIADAPSDAPWLNAAMSQLARLEGPEAAPPGRVAPGPAPEDVEAAASLPPDERLAMIEGMVASLAARLETNPGDADGWARLIRSYMVLDRPEEARAALDKARVALAGDADKRALLDATARDLGLVQ